MHVFVLRDLCCFLQQHDAGFMGYSIKGIKKLFADATESGTDERAGSYKLLLPRIFHGFEEIIQVCHRTNALYHQHKVFTYLP